MTDKILKIKCKSCNILYLEECFLNKDCNKFACPKCGRANEFNEIDNSDDDPVLHKMHVDIVLQSSFIVEIASDIKPKVGQTYTSKNKTVFIIRSVKDGRNYLLRGPEEANKTFWKIELESIYGRYDAIQNQELILERKK